MQWVIGLLLISAATLNSGCVDAPPPKFMQEENRKLIVIGSTTEAQVREILGRPQEIRTVSDGSGDVTVWTYQYVRRGTRELVPGLEEKLSKPALRSLLKVEFNPDHTVKKLDRMDREIRTREEGGIITPF